VESTGFGSGCGDSGGDSSSDWGGESREGSGDLRGKCRGVAGERREWRRFLRLDISREEEGERFGEEEHDRWARGGSGREREKAAGLTCWAGSAAVGSGPAQLDCYSFFYSNSFSYFLFSCFVSLICLRHFYLVLVQL
jgi:hypothetical protein